MPAVSIKRNDMPFISVTSSITSRVVPSMLDTIARSSPKRALRRVDFPTFVFPMMATAMPSLSACPILKEWSSDNTFLSISSVRLSNAGSIYKAE